jgi:NAD(P)H dehydrogenase (quinone)
MAGDGVRVLVAFHSRHGHVEELAGEVAAAARRVPATEVTVVHVGAVTRADLLACDALVVGTPVHSGSMAAPVKQFFDDWHLRFDFYPGRPMRDRVGAAFAAGGQGDGGREFAMLGILSAMLHHHMLVVAGDSGIGASVATEGPVPGVDESARERARGLGLRVAQVAHMVRLGRTGEARPLP